MSDTLADPQPAGQDEALTVMVCDADLLAVAALRSACVDAGFVVAHESTNPVEAYNQTAFVRPHLLLAGSDFWGMSGVDLAELVRREAKDPPEVVLVLSDVSQRDAALAAGAFAIAPRGDLGALERVLTEVRTFLLTHERRTASERREGPDRRVHQDWSKVTWEHRSGADRRDDDRRSVPPTTSDEDE